MAFTTTTKENYHKTMWESKSKRKRGSLKVGIECKEEYEEHAFVPLTDGTSLLPTIDE